MYALGIYNKTPVQRLRWKTPSEKLLGTKPNVSNIQVFGCGAYVWLPKQIRKTKLQPKAELMTFIGFGQSGNYQFMRNNNSIFEASTVIFDEELYPRCKDSKRRAVTRIGSRSNNSNPTSPTPQADDDTGSSSSSFTSRRPTPSSAPAAPSAAPAYTRPPEYATKTPSPPPFDSENQNKEQDDNGEFDSAFKSSRPKLEPSVSAKGKGREPGPSYSLRSGNIPGFNVESPSTDDEPENPFLTSPKTPPKKQVKLMPPPVRRSDRLRKPNIQPDSIYGKKSPTSILKRKERKPDRQLQLEIDEGTHETRSQSPQSDEQVP